MGLSIKVLIYSGRENSANFYKREGSCFWLFSPWSRIGHALHPVFMLWLLKLWQVSSRGKIYALSGNLFTDSWNWQFVSSYSCTIWKTAAIMILLVEKCAAFPSHRKCFPFSDGMVFKNQPLLRLSVCVRGLKSLKRFWPYLMAFRSCISTGKPE